MLDAGKDMVVDSVSELLRKAEEVVRVCHRGFARIRDLVSRPELARCNHAEH